MKYPAIIKKEKDGKYSVSFPDFNGGKFGLCVSCGDTLEEAKKNAEEALSLHVLGLIEDAECVSLSSRIASLPTTSIAINIEV
tara:strand:+ start:1173 stop:1421 length:249 start_codon:yes stop_codon:yes gene_type:complete